MSRFDVTVLGTASGGVPGAGNAGSGYLVTAGDTRVLVDCGNGVLGNLRQHLDYGSVDAVFVSHLHADHVMDLAPFSLFLRFTGRRVPLFAPEGARTLLYRWFSLFHNDPESYVNAFDLREVEPWSAENLGGIRFQACPVEHNVPCLGFRAEPVDGGPRLFYSGDTRAGGLVTEGAQGADLFLADATFQGSGDEGSRAHHMTAREAAEVAARAGVKRLVLTHLLDHLDPEVSVREAREAFDGPVDVARPGGVYALSDA